MTDERITAALARVAERARAFARATMDHKGACWGETAAPVLFWRSFRWVERVSAPGVSEGRPSRLILHFGRFELVAPLGALSDREMATSKGLPRGGPPDDYDWEREALAWRLAGTPLDQLPLLPGVVIRRERALRQLGALLVDAGPGGRSFVRTAIAAQRSRPRREIPPREPVGIDLYKSALEAEAAGNRRTAAALFGRALHWGTIETGEALGELDLNPLRDTFSSLARLARSVGEDHTARSLQRSADAWLTYGVERRSSLDLRTAGLVGSLSDGPELGKKPR